MKNYCNNKQIFKIITKYITPQSEKISKGLLITIRVIKILLHTNFPTPVAHLLIKFEDSTWHSSKPVDNIRIQWNQSHTFEIAKIVPMYIGVYHKTGLFKQVEYCSCMIKSENFSRKKGIKYTEIYNQSDKVSVFWTYVIEDKKNDNLELLRLINETEAEREEIRYYKSKMKLKMIRLKEKSYACKEELKNLIQNFQPILEFCNAKEKKDYQMILDERIKVQDQKIGLIQLKVEIEKKIEMLRKINNQYE